ncbi:PF08929 domain protein [Acinetobacter sp. WC-323]|uniref:PoNe immunity protein domain-containing protein n=1 Tax=Acinetobacter sp. WC-323 TaxID=903918 RepID=UPI00029E0D8A|nr:PoNe immunity protein domain-containing protein [Acinetobacter sp. WC-323]EKU56453.1 PF08929 domain protein [Acinetobacter sp. WC-323]
MYHIDQANEFEKLQQLLEVLNGVVSDVQNWRVPQPGCLDHWNSIKEQIIEYKKNEYLFFDSYPSAAIDIYQLLELDIYFKNFCLEITYLIRLGYDLGLTADQIRDIYQSVYAFWLAYADLLSLIQQQGHSTGITAIQLTTDYAHALLLLCCAICYGDETDIVKIIDGLLGDPSDCLIDLISYPYLEVESISSDYAVSYPFQQLDQLLNTSVDASSIGEYVEQIERDQQQGKYWSKKFFHHIALFGKWRFEALILCKLYQIDLNEMTQYQSFPEVFSKISDQTSTIT